MIAVPISKPVPPSRPSSPAHAAQSLIPGPVEKPADLAQLLIAGTLIAGGAMIVAGHRRSGAAVATVGAALALLEEQEAVTAWWKKAPKYLAQAQEFLDRVEHSVEEAAAQGRRLHQILRR